MKILFVNTLDDPQHGAGAERTISVLMHSLRQVGHETVIAGTSDIPGLHQTERQGMRVWRAGLRNLYWPKRGEKVAWPLRRIWHLLDAYNKHMATQFEDILRIERPDVISAHNLPGWSISILDAARAFQKPVVQVLHDYYYVCANTKLYKADKDCVSQCASCLFLRRRHRAKSSSVHAVVGVSRYVLQRHQDLGYFLNGPVPHVIHNVRSPALLKLDQGPVRRWNLDGRKLVLGFIGTIDEHKGIELLLKTFRDLPLGQAELLIAGSGKPGYVSYLQQKYGGNGITFLGQVVPHEFYPLVDLTIVPSLWAENFPGVVLESFAFGVPAIGSRRGGIPEIIAPGRNGSLFEPGEPSSLRLTIEGYLQNREMLYKQSRNARLDAEPFLDTSTWVSRYLDVYAAAANSPPGH